MGDYELNKCVCGKTPILCEPNYADDSDTMVVCEYCDRHTDGFIFGEYREGSELAVEAWNRGEINQYHD